MKKQLFAWMLVFLSAAGAVSCSQDEPAVMAMEGPTSKVDETSMNAAHRTASDAIARAIYDRESMLGVKTPMSRSGEIKVKCIMSSAKSRGGASDSLYYAVDFPENSGYAIVPVNGQLSSLAVTESGSYDDIATSDNEPLKWFMAAAEEYVIAETASTPTISFPKDFEMFELDTLAYSNVKPRVKARWAQYGSLAKYFPNGYTGCTPLACAMTLSYYKNPTSVQLTFPGSDNTKLSLIWSGINKHIKEEPFWGTCACAAGETNHDAIAKLCRELAHRMSARYEYFGTGARLDSAMIALKEIAPYIKYDYKYYSQSSPSEDIDKGILIMAGTPTDTLGHTWIVDGRYLERINRKVYKVQNPGAFNERKTLLSVSEYSNINTFHINWGYGGASNGMFAAGVFRTLAGRSLTDVDSAEDGVVQNDRTYPITSIRYIATQSNVIIPDDIIFKPIF